MNTTTSRFFLGLGYGFISSLVTSFLGVMTIALLSGGGGGIFYTILEFFLNSFIPLSLSFGISGYFSAFRYVSRLKFWVISAIIGFLNVLWMGTAGSIVVRGLFYGFDTVNIGGYLQFGPLIALYLLPISTLVVAFLLYVLQSIWEPKQETPEY